MASFTSFQDFAARASSSSSFVFIGSDTRESFSAFTGMEWRPKGPIKVRMNGGDDRVRLYGGAPGGRFDGGDGIDRLDYADGYAPGRHVDLNLESGLLRTRWANGETKRRVVHFEAAAVSNGQGFAAGPTTIYGTRGENWLKVWGPGAATIYGKAGDDELFGGSGDSVLIGGKGRDVAHGERGTDRCDAEIRLHCERWT